MKYHNVSRPNTIRSVSTESERGCADISSLAVNLLNAKLNPNCKFQLTEFF
jgi:hypothetical protein